MSKPLLLSGGSGKVQELVGTATGQTVVWSAGPNEWAAGTVNIATGVTGTLPVANGGTGLGAPVSGDAGKLLTATALGTYELATLPNVGTAGTYGSASSVPVFSTDAQGRVTSATNTNIDFAGNTVTSLTGTANQVILTGGPTGAITLALPQSIATTSSPTFSSMTLGGTLSFSALAYFRPASDNAIRLQPNTGNSFFFFGETRSTGTAVSAFFQGGAASGTVTAGGSAIIYGGSGTGTNTSGGNVSIEGGIATGSGTVGQITIGVSTTPRTSSVTIGRSAITTTINGTLVSNGTIIAATAAVDTNTTQVATTAYVIGQGYLKSATAASTYAPLASPTFTGTVTIPAGASISGFAPLASPAFTGTPLSTTAAADNNSTQIATTAYVVGQASSSAPVMDGSATIGTSLKYARADHVHPSDTSRAPLASPTFTGTVKATKIEVVEEVKLTSNAFTSVYTRSPAGGTPMSIEGDFSSAANSGGRLSIYGGRDYVGTGGGELGLTGGLSYVGAAVPGFVRINGGSSISPATGRGGDVIIDGGSGGVGADNGSIQLGTFTTKQINIGAATANTIQLRGPVTVTDTIALGNFATAGTAAVSTNTTQIATTAFVVGQASTLVPFMDGSAAIGTELKYARADHVHPSDTSRAPLASPTFTGTVTLPLTTAGYVKTTLAGVISSSATVAVADLSGAVSVANGGTNNASLPVAEGTVYYGNGSQLVGLAPGNSGEFLQTQGAGAAPQWAAGGGGGGGGTVTSVTLNAGSTGLTISAGYSQTITTSGTFLLGGTLGAGYGGTGVTTAAANTVFAGPSSGGNAAPSFRTLGVAEVTGAAPLASPTFTGTVTIPAGASISGFAPLASPAFSGTPSLPTGTTGVTQTANDGSTKLATTLYADTAASNAKGAPYDLPAEIPGTPDVSKKVVNFKAVRAFTLAATGHQGGQLTAPSGNFVCTVMKNGASIGTITFGTSSFSSSVTATSFETGDVLSVETPAAALNIDTPFFTLFMTLA